MGCFQEGKKPEETYCSFDAATLVIHEGKHERVFTEIEVRAMLREICGLAQAYWDNAGHGAPDMLSASEVDGIAATHGIVLDPA